MGMQKCMHGHEIRLPHYGPYPPCADCVDMIDDYAGVNGDQDTEDDLECLDQDEDD